LNFSNNNIQRKKKEFGVVISWWLQQLGPRVNNLSINGPYDFANLMWHVDLLNGSIEKTRLLATAFRNNQHQAMSRWSHELVPTKELYNIIILLFGSGKTLSFCQWSFLSNHLNSLNNIDGCDQWEYSSIGFLLKRFFLDAAARMPRKWENTKGKQNKFFEV